MYFRKTWMFIKKDYLIAANYQMAFVISLISAAFPIISLFFMSHLIKHDNLSLSKYGGNYFSFALVGSAFSGYFLLAVGTFSNNIKRAQAAGCLEAILSSQTGPKSIVIMSSIYSFLSAGLQIIFLFIIGAIFFGFDFSNTNIAATLLALIASLLTFISLGIFSAAGTVIFKQGDPVGWIFGILTSLLSGVVFPVSIMPKWLQIIASSFPVTHSLDALRLTILQNYSVSMIGEQLTILTCMGLILFPLSLFTFEWAVERGKRDGTLMHY